MLAALASFPATKALDPDPFPRHSLRHPVYAAPLHFGFETASNNIAGKIVVITGATAAWARPPHESLGAGGRMVLGARRAERLQALADDLTRPAARHWP